MSGFKELRQKVKNTFEDNNLTKYLFSLRENLKNKLWGQSENFVVPKIIHDSGWLSKSTTEIDSQYATKGDLTFQSLAYDYTLEDLEISEDLFPFIQTNVIAKAPHDSEIYSLLLIDGNTKREYCEVRSGGLIFSGPPQNIYYRYSKDDVLKSGIYSFSHYTDVYRGDITWTNYVSDDVYEIKNAQIDKINWVEITSSECGGGNDTHIFNGLAIHTISSTAVTATGDETITAYVTNPSPGPTCLEQNIKNTGIKLTKNFADLEDYTIYYSDAEYYKNGELLHSNAHGSVGTYINIINSKLFTSTDFYRVYYSDAYRFTFGIKTTGTPEGDFTSRELDNVPDEDVYSSITFQRNQGTNPQILQSDTKMRQRVNKSEVWFLKDENIRNNINKYYFSLHGGFYLKSPARKGNKIFPRYDDTYNISGSSYSITKNHDFNDEVLEYVSASRDIEYKIQITAIPPLNYHSIKNYKKKNL